jgi:hypothetical protein
MALPDPPPPEEKLSDAAIAALLNKDAFKASVGRAKNFRLIGMGLNPLIIYGSAVAFVLLWFFGAWALSMFGPWFALAVTAGVCGTAFYLSARESRRDARSNAGLCPQCGYDLRASNDRCPECGGPIPEPILRWRRLRPPQEPGMPGYVPPKLPRSVPTAPPPRTP